MSNSPIGSNDSLDEGTAVCYIDGFKQINDTHGHQFGDDVIARVNEIGVECVTDSADFTRESGQGDESLVILGDTGKDRARSTMETFQETILDDEPNGAKVTVSIGIAGTQTESPNFEEVKGRAEEAMRRAKKWGGNQVQVYGEFEPLREADVKFDLQATPGCPDDLMGVET